MKRELSYPGVKIRIIKTGHIFTEGDIVLVSSDIAISLQEKGITDGRIIPEGFFKRGISNGSK